MTIYCELMELPSSLKQIRLLREKRLFDDEIAPALRELRRRIREDFEERAFFIINDPTKLRRFFKMTDLQLCEQKETVLVLKPANELFDESVIRQFPAAIDDIEQACMCYVLARYSACVFHLMRIVEVAVLRVAKISGLSDPKPSWGAVLQYVEKIVLRTPKDLDNNVRCHIPLLTTLLPQMQSIQRAWRNKIVHIEDRIIPVEARIDEEVGADIMNSVQVFMRHLASELPPGP